VIRVTTYSVPLTAFCDKVSTSTPGGVAAAGDATAKDPTMPSPAMNVNAFMAVRVSQPDWSAVENGRVSVRCMADSYLLTNGPIWTGDPSRPWAQAVVVRGRDLVHVGTRQAADEFVDSATEFVDLKGGMCLPGFIDAHNHLASMALSKLGVNLSGVVGRDVVLAAVRDWIATQPADAPLRGHGWMPDSFEERSPRREWLDEITGDRPMYLFSADAHDSWFNTAAMRDAGIGPNTPDPDWGAAALAVLWSCPR
jgi:hypothetical protein